MAVRRQRKSVIAAAAFIAVLSILALPTIDADPPSARVVAAKS